MTTTVETSTDREAVSTIQLVGPSSSGVEILHLDHQDRLVDTLLRLGQLRTLVEDWNSYGSPPPSERLIQIVEEIVTAADTFFAPFLPVPHVVPVPGGGIKLTWCNGDRELEIEFGPIEEGRLEIEFLTVSHGEPLNEGPVVGAELVEHLTWIIQG